MSAASRDEEIRAFLDEAGWKGARLAPLAGDASTRRYIRVTNGGRSAMLMDQPQGAEAPSAGAYATPDERRRLGYNAVARLAGADCGRFVAVDAYLRRAGLAAPEIYAADTEAGLLLLEDLGNNLYSEALEHGADEAELYAAALDAIAAIHREPAPAALNGTPLFAYDETALLAEVDLLTEWFLPLALKRPTRAEEAREHRHLWAGILAPLLDAPRVFVHRDYHAQNLFWRPEQGGLSRVAIIDFQDAVAGHPAYDLVSLLEDARRDVSPELAKTMLGRYLDQTGRAGERSEFEAQAAVLAAQRNAKIIGIFGRLAERDGKRRYLAHLPRVWRYMERDLAHPVLNDLRTWYETNVPPESRGGAIKL